MLLKTRQKSKGQSLVEYLIICGVVIAAITAFHAKFKSGVTHGLEKANEAMKKATDKLPDLLK